jgi:hypothetical protein
MRPDSRPIDVTLDLPSLSDDAVVEIQDFLYQVLDLFMTHYGHQVNRFYDENSYDNFVQHDHNPKPPDDPPF